MLAVRADCEGPRARQPTDGLSVALVTFGERGGEADLSTSLVAREHEYGTFAPRCRLGIGDDVDMPPVRTDGQGSWTAELVDGAFRSGHDSEERQLSPAVPLKGREGRRGQGQQVGMSPARCYCHTAGALQRGLRELRGASAHKRVAENQLRGHRGVRKL
eukprot:scaffold819_cov239-Pinguiococcus_pyrenoidosus.AAC.12